jgi:hypothetical protein
MKLEKGFLLYTVLLFYKDTLLSSGLYVLIVVLPKFQFVKHVIRSILSLYYWPSSDKWIQDIIAIGVEMLCLVACSRRIA